MREKLIEEMGVDICKGCDSRLDPTFECSRNVCTMAEVVSKYLISEGWTKQIWHKVADGDLPEYAGRYLVILDDESLPEYCVDSYKYFWGGKRWVYNEGRVIAWAELPEYKELQI